MAGEIPEVLFVCVHNAGRSQMAAGLLDQHARGRVHVRSAGSELASSLNPRVVEAMREIGIDISREFPKPLTDDFVRAADVVITMGCGDAARSTRASATRIGTWKSRRARIFKRSDASETRSTSASERWSES